MKTSETAFKTLTMTAALVLACARGNAEPATTTVAPAAAPNDPIAAILGSPTANWKFTPEVKPTVYAGVPVLSSGGATLVLAGDKDYGPDAEYTAVFHFNAAPGAFGGVNFQIGNKQQTVFTATNPSVMLYPSTTDKHQPWYIYDRPGGKGYKNYGYEYLKDSIPRNLSWPEALRKSVEKESAAQQGVGERWFTVRIVTHRGLAQFWMDDRFLDQRDEPGLDVSGKIYISMYPHTDLAQLTVKALPAGEQRFMPVSLHGYLNAADLNGAPVQPAALPNPAATRQIGGIPFIFPGRDSRGNDHVALAKSWAQFSSLEGYVESNYGDFGGRWTSAFSGNPARIQLRLPFDSYNNLHLIAASDDSPDSVPVVTAQFYKESAGYPENFAARVPRFSQRAGNVTTLPVKLANGRAGSLYLVTIPVDPGKLSGLKYGDVISIELTKEVKLFRSYPDPICFSYHQGGLPSSVHIYAATLERTLVQVDFNPDKFGHVWTAPAMPSYTVALRNISDKPRAVQLELTTVSHDGSEKTLDHQNVTLAAGQKDATARFALGSLKKYGYHDVKLTIKDGAQTWVENRSLAWLSPDTRERLNWADGKGPAMGFWGWGGGHETPTTMQEYEVMAAAGAQTSLASLGQKSTSQEIKDFARKNGLFSSLVFDGGSMYTLGFSLAPLNGQYKPNDPAANLALLLSELKKVESSDDDISHPIEIPYFPEPGLGPFTYGSLPEYYGDPDHVFTPDEQKMYDYYLERFLLSAGTLRKMYPKAKLLLPYGDPLFAVPFLCDARAREFIDGCALDMPAFERTPESQLHQVVHHRLYELVNEFKKYGKTPHLAVYEGPCADTPTGALTWAEQSDYYTRMYMLYFAYGVYRHPSGPTPFDCANYWGEEHYGACGLFARLPHANPKPSYVAYATMTRHLNRANFTKWLPTGSLTGYCLQFKNVNDGHLVHSLWTIRGKRAVTLTVPAGSHVTYYDQDDNPVELASKNGQVSLTLTTSPCYLEGITGDPQVAVGTPDNSDARPGPIAARLANLGDGSWTTSTERDKQYENNDVLQIVRFPGNFTIAPQAAPTGARGKALAVHLGAQDKERKVMPWYTTLMPKQPIAIAGKGSHLGLRVKGNSDWGRVVYSLRDAKGEHWLSIGTQDSWNCDDTKTVSYFNFDGWRYLRFELPSNLGYDSYREAGSTWWGHHGGDGIIDLPLSLDKIIVERRSHAIYVNDVQPANPADVLLGDLNVEYADAFDRTPAVVAQSRVRMKVPEGVPALENPIPDLTAKGLGDPTRITHVDPPPHDYDGTRGLVFFDAVPGATAYDIWVSPYPDGTGAMKLATAWKEPGQLLQGLHADQDFYLFVVYTDKDGKASKPSAAFKIHLKDMFAMK